MGSTFFVFTLGHVAHFRQICQNRLMVNQPFDIDQPRKSRPTRRKVTNQVEKNLCGHFNFKFQVWNFVNRFFFTCGQFVIFRQICQNRLMVNQPFDTDQPRKGRPTKRKVTNQSKIKNRGGHFADFKLKLKFFARVANLWIFDKSVKMGLWSTNHRGRPTKEKSTNPRKSWPTKEKGL